MTVVMNETRKAVIGVLKNAKAPMTLEQIGAAIGVDLKTGTTNAMVSAGMIVKAGTVAVKKMGTDTRKTYTFDTMPKAGAKFQMNENRNAIAAALTDKVLTLKQVGEAVGFEVKSGTINAMVAAGVVRVAGETKVQSLKTKKVETYVIGNVEAAE